jgi:DNA-binding CsgD family transcriptional regulator
MKKLKQLYEEFTTLQFNLPDDSNRTFESKKEQIMQLAKAENLSMAIYDLNSHEYHFLHGYESDMSSIQQPCFDLEKFHELVHAADLRHALEARIKAFYFRQKINAGEEKDYMLLFECRLKDCSGKYRRVLHKFLVLEQDDRGEIWLLLLKLCPVVGEDTETPPRGVFIVNIHTLEFAVTDSEYGFTPAEMTVLKLLSEGLGSKQIAKKLHNSPHTINNHRRNILRKTQTATTERAVMYARDMGIV